MSWSLTWVAGGKPCKKFYNSKLAAVSQYMNIPQILHDISELKIWRGDEDYTSKLNKFLYPKGE